MADVIAANSEAALSFEDQQAARDLLANLRHDSTIDQARLLVNRDDGWLGFADYSRPGAQLQQVELAALKDAAFALDKLHVLRPVMQDGRTIGGIYLQVRLDQIDALLLRFATVTLVLAILTLCLAWLLARRLQGVITAQVTELIDTTQSVRAEKNYSLRSRVLAEDELGELAHGVNAMLAEVESHDRAREKVEHEIRELNEQLESKVRFRTQDLAASNLDLKEAVETLRCTQKQLVESEKMAALGGLVAGVAHEINTPIGICVTVASHLNERLEHLNEAYRRGIRKSELERFVEDSTQAVTMISANLSRAADLVRSFKRVAVDQGSEDRRRFNLASYVAESLIALGPRLKQRFKPVQVELRIEDDLQIDSYPGVFAQIITNLVINALLHAWPEDEGGRILIAARRLGAEVELVVEDDGCGMEEDIRSRVFEPFFTTKRGSGGSGLGLHITFNQVTRQLGGSINCESRPQAGARFVLRFPASSPAAREAGDASRSA
nr:ATP-binding protein [Pseudomarimonas arenosa]